MKKICLLFSIVAAGIIFSYCSSPKKVTAAVPAPKEEVKVIKVNYQANVRPIVEANCAPCHFPDKGGNKKALDSYSGVSAQVDELLSRIQLNPGERGFMPRQHAKLSDSTISVIKKWKADGLTEK